MGTSTQTSLNSDLVKPGTNGVISKKRPLSITSEGSPPLSQGVKKLVNSLTQ